MAKRRISRNDARLQDQMNAVERAFIDLIIAIAATVSRSIKWLARRRLPIAGSILSALGIVLLLVAMITAPDKPDSWLGPVLLFGVPGLVLLLVWLKYVSEDAAKSVQRAAARERLEHREMQEELRQEGYDLEKIERKIESGDAFRLTADGEIAFEEKPTNKKTRHPSK